MDCRRRLWACYSDRRCDPRRLFQSRPRDCGRHWGFARHHTRRLHCRQRRACDGFPVSISCRRNRVARDRCAQYSWDYAGRSARRGRGKRLNHDLRSKTAADRQKVHWRFARMSCSVVLRLAAIVALDQSSQVRLKLRLVRSVPPAPFADFTGPMLPHVSSDPASSFRVDLMKPFWEQLDQCEQHNPCSLCRCSR